MEVCARQMQVAFGTDGLLADGQPLAAHHAEPWGDQVEQSVPETNHHEDLQIYDLVFSLFVDIDVIHIQALADDVEAKTSSQGKTHELLIQFVVACSPDALPFLFQ